MPIRQPRKVIVVTETVPLVATPKRSGLSMLVVETETGKRKVEMELPLTLSVADLRSLLANHEQEAEQRAQQNAADEKDARDVKNFEARRACFKAQATKWAKSLGRPFKVTTSEVHDFWFSMTVSLTVTPGVVLRIDLNKEDTAKNDGLMTVTYAYLDCKALDVTREKHLGEHEKFENALKAADKFAKSVFKLNLADMPVMARMMNDD